QASSGKGATGLFELDAQVAALGRGEPVPAVKAHAARLAGNVLPHAWEAGDGGYTEEGRKKVRETHKNMGNNSLRVSPTTARGARAGAHRQLRGGQSGVSQAHHGGTGVDRATQGPGPRFAGRFDQGRSTAAARLRRARRSVRWPGAARSDGGERPQLVGGGRQ